MTRDLAWGAVFVAAAAAFGVLASVAEENWGYSFAGMILSWTVGWGYMERYFRERRRRAEETEAKEDAK